MAHKTLVNGTAYEISGGKALVGGTAYEIGKGKTLVGGTAYEIGFGVKVGDLAVGSSVFMNVNGVSTEFLVVHQGLPDATLYDASCDGTWLLTKNIPSEYYFGLVYAEGGGSSAKGNQYEYSSIHSYISGWGFFDLLDGNIQSIIKQVKIPYHKGYGNDGSVAYGSDGLSTKIFLLSGYEVGWNDATSAYFPVDGACLEYFSGLSDTDSVRIGYYNGTADSWWLRSPNTGDHLKVWCVTPSGGCSRSNYTNAMGARTALILPSDTAIDENFNVIA